MWQNIITGLIVFLVLGVTLYRIVDYFRNPLKGCEGCSSHCNTCSLEELKKEIEEKKEQRNGFGIQN